MGRPDNTDVPPQTPRILIAEDEGLLRDGVSRLLTEAGFDVVAETDNAGDARAMALQHRPDVALLDVRMPPDHTDDGLRVAEFLDRELPSTAVLVLSHHVEPHYAMTLLRRRARGTGYLLKQNVAGGSVLAEAVRRVLAGGSVIDPEVVAVLMNRRRQTNPLDDLTAKEREILGLMAEGRTNTAIAEHLVVSPKTVETHVGHVFRKLGLPPGLHDHRRVMAVLAYLRDGGGFVTGP